MALSNKIRIAFYKGPVNWRTRIVMWWTGSEYTHAELVLPSGDSLGICPDDAGTVRLRKIKFQENLKTKVVITQRERNLDSSDVEPPPKVDLDLRKAIQQGRQAKNLTQKQLANMVQMKPSDIQAYENGKAVPKHQEIQKIQRALGVKLTGLKKK